MSRKSIKMKSEVLSARLKSCEKWCSRLVTSSLMVKEARLPHFPSRRFFFIRGDLVIKKSFTHRTDHDPSGQLLFICVDDPYVTVGSLEGPSCARYRAGCRARRVAQKLPVGFSDSR